MNQMTFAQWMDAEKQKALQDPVGQWLESLGANFYHSGGGCLGWELVLPDDRRILVGDGDSKADFAGSLACGMCICFDLSDAAGDFEDSEEFEDVETMKARILHLLGG